MDYKIQLGVDVDVSDIQSQINSKVKDTLIPIKLEIENIGDIKKQIQSLGVLKGGIEIPLTIDTNAAIKSAQQVGQKIGSTATKSVQKSLNIDGLFEKEARALMKEYGISTKSKSGVAAKDEIKKALSSYVNEARSGGKTINDEFFGSFNTIDTALRKVTDAITKNKKEVIELDSLYEDLIRDIKSINNGKGAVKISLPDMRSEWGDDYSKNKDLLGSWFSEKYAGAAGSIGIDSWVKSKNWSSLLDLSGSHQDIANQLVKLIEKTKTVYSGDELFREGFLKIDDVEARIKESASNITAAEQKMIQSSNSATDTIVQNQQRQQEAIKASLEAKKAEIEQEKKRLAEINKSVDDYNNRFMEASTTGDPNAMEYYAKMQSLEADSEALDSHIKNLKAAYDKEVQLAQEAANAINQAEERKQQAFQETAKEFLAVQKGSFQRAFSPADKEFGGINNTAKSVEEYFKGVNGVLADTVSVQERFDADKNLNGFTVSLKNANGAAEQLRYTLRTVEDAGSFFEYTGGSINDNGVLKQMNAISAKADALQNKLDKLKSEYSDSNVTKPIKDADHISELSKQYKKVENAILDVRNADESTFASMVSNAEKEKTALENMVREFRNAENVSLQMKGNDYESGRAIAKEKYEKLLADAKGFSVDTSKLDIDGVTDVASLNKFTDALRVARAELDKLKAEAASAKREIDSSNREKALGIDVNDLRRSIESVQKISPEIKDFKAEINGAEVAVKSLLDSLNDVNTQSDFRVARKNFESFTKAAQEAGIAVTKVQKESVDKKASDEEAKKINDAYKQMLETQKQIRSLSIKEKNLTELGNTNELNEVSAKLKELKSDYEALSRTFGGKLTSAQFGTLQAEIDETESELKQLDAKFADTKAKLAKSIKMDIESGNFENQFDTMLAKFDSLSDANDELRRSYDATKDAYKAMTDAAKADSGDEVADREKLIQAEKRYAEALEKTNNLIKIQARADKIDADNLRLQDDREVFQAKIDNWLAKNSAATEKFGAKLMELRAKAESADRVELNHLEKELTKVDKAADKAGLKMMSLGDRIKSKFKEYSAYLGVAEVFMWIEQGMREMFNTVLEIDTAMTGLYRVTDLTSAQYDTLFNNMIDSAKEYGATLNDIINATSDWVRAGFDADTALGLAEVTTMYQHISDLDYDTAAENLITAYNGFKDELNTAFSGDQVAAVEYIADIFNELDRRNCP